MVQVREYQPLKTEESINIEAWLERLQQELGGQSVEAVKQACAVAEKAVLNREAGSYHSDAWGNCYFAGLEIAEILVDLKQDSETLVAGVLYRAVRERKLPLSSVRRDFGIKVAHLIEGVQQMAAISAVQQPQHKAVLGDTQRQIDNVRKMLVAMVDDVRVALIKLAERTWAIRAVKNAQESRKQKIAREVFDIYAPLAHRLGIGHIKWELEDVSFRYLSPDKYKVVAKLLDERRLDRERYISEVVDVLESRLRENQIDAVVTGRVKHIYSIWRKMQHKKIDFDQVYDVRALRVLVPQVRDCYATLGVVHEIWRHIPQEFDDYIAMPKRNGYRSLHTAVFGPEGKGMEIQIRTHEMHENAEFGVCSHWSYKGTDTDSSARGYEEKISWLRHVLKWHDEVGDLQSLVEELEIDITSDRVYVFTPAGHIVDLPHGATPIDFAYRVHTEVGHHCQGCKANGHIVPLNYQLQTGDHLEILTSKSGSPSRDWLNPALGYVAASRTRTKIQHWFKAQDRDKNIQAGRAMIEREIKRLAIRSLDLDRLAIDVNYKNADDMFSATGAGYLRIAQVLGAAQTQLTTPLKQDQLKLKLPSGPSTEDLAYDLQCQGVGNLLSNLAGCCKPVPGDDCIGYITIGRGMSIHRGDCINVVKLAKDEPGRIIDVQWGNKVEVNYPVDVLIQAFDRQGLLLDVTAILADEAVNVTNVRSETDGQNNLVELKLTMEVPNLVALGKVLTKISQLPNVFEAKRYRQGG